MAKDKTAVEDPEFVNFRVGDTTYRTQLNRSYRDRKPYTPPNAKHSLAFIPGTIAKVNVKKGDAVKQGDIMVLLEAMKMQNQVKAPFDGIVKEVYVEVGQIVAKNVLILELV